MAVVVVNPPKEVARGLAALYRDDEYGMLQKDMHGALDVSGISKAVCLGIILHFGDQTLGENLVGIFLRWVASGIPKENWDIGLLEGYECYRTNLAESLAWNILRLYGGSESLKADLAKAALMKNIDIPGYPRVG